MRHFLLLPLILLLFACTQAPVSFDYESSAHLKTMKTYSLLSPGDSPAFKSLDNNRIEAALRRTLNGRQLQEVAKEQANFLVSYRVEQDRKIDDSGVSFGFGVGSGNLGMGVGTGTQLREVVEGKLVVDIIDPDKKQVVWSARANRNLNDSMSPGERDELIKTLVAAMFESFPPQ